MKTIIRNGSANTVPGYFIKGRRIAVFTLGKLHLIIDQYSGHKNDDVKFNKYNHCYSYENRLHFFVALHRLIKSYADSKRSWHTYPLCIKGDA